MSGSDSSDCLDIASERAQLAIDAAVAAIRAKAVIDPGKPGFCDDCGYWSARLIKSCCALCRNAQPRTTRT